MGKKNRLEYTDEELGAIYDLGKDATVSFLKILIDKINVLTEKVEKLEQQISSNSKNSNKPPSIDNPFKKQTKSLRKKGGKSGGQKDHIGSQLEQKATPDKIIHLKATGKCSCGTSISEGIIINHTKRQLFDLPEIKINVTEYQAEIVKCDCGKLHYAEFPDEARVKAQYGKNIKALIVYLKYYGFLSYDRIQDFMADVCNQKMSQGTLVNIIRECSDHVASIAMKIKESLINENVVNFDETGLRVEGNLHWLHTASTSQYTCYFFHKKRGKIAMDAMGILPLFHGTAVHDHWESYFRYTTCIHSLCNAHHLRELLFFREQEEQWAKEMMDYLVKAHKEKKKDLKLSKRRIKYYRKKLAQCILQGLKIHPKIENSEKKRGRDKQSKAHNLLSRLKNRINDVIRFLLDSEVPFDNNQAERDVRMAKVQQKISGTFRSKQGAEDFCIIRSYLSTAKKQGHSVFNAILAGFCKQDTIVF